MDVESIHLSEIPEEIVLAGVDYVEADGLNHRVSGLIQKFDPDVIALALCEKRFETLETKKEWEDKALLSSYREGKFSVLLYQAFVDAIHENVRRIREIEPESHIAKLASVASGFDKEVEFIDQDITETLSHAFRRMSILKKLKLLWYFRSALIPLSEEKETVSAEEIEEHDDIVESVLRSIGRFAPMVAEEAEKDRLNHMAEKIYEIGSEKKVVAVVPASKVKKIKARIIELAETKGERRCRKPLEELDTVFRSVYKKALRYGSSALFITLAVYLFLFSDVMNVWRASFYWFLAVGGSAALGAALARGHPLSILTSFILAPFMSLTLIGPGWVAGYVEAKVRSPKVSDITELTLSTSINEVLSNDLIKVFTVGIFSNLLTWVGLFIVLPLLISLFG